MKILVQCAAAVCAVLMCTHSIFAQSPRAFQKELPVIADGVDRPVSAIPCTAVQVSDSGPQPFWSSMGSSSINGSVFAFNTTSYNYAVMGGAFDSVNGRPLAHVGWQQRGDTAWSPLGVGIVGTAVYAVVLDLESYKGSSYVAGNFTRAGGIEAHNIAHWTGLAWETLGSGVDSTVLALAIVDSFLYVGGNFLHAGGRPANHIARWNMNSQQWSPIMDGDSNGVNGGVASIVKSSYYGPVYVGGGFTRAGRIEAEKIAMLTDSGWEALGSGVTGANAFVGAITGARHYYYSTVRVIACGEFSSAGNATVNNVAMWDPDSARWMAMGANGLPGVNGPAYGVAGFQDDFVVLTGAFLQAGNGAVNNVAWFDGTKWGPMQAGIDGIGYGVDMEMLPIVTSQWPSLNARVTVWGGFSHGDTVPAAGIAQWTLYGEVSVHDSPQPASAVLCTGYPNPVNAANSDATISYSLATSSHANLSIVDMLGRTTATLVNGSVDPGTHSVHWSPGALPAGTYTVALRTDREYASMRLVIAR